jgi:uncharacterized membrane protein YdjX (TVP38/TMEM64 family)
VAATSPEWASARLRIAALLAVAAVLCALWWSGALADVANPEHVRAFLTERGPLGPLLWLLAFACLEPFGMPGAAFLIPASLLWPPALAIPLGVAGSTGAGIVAFVLARWIGREVLLERLPENVKKRTAPAREHGFRTALAVRLALFLFPPAHWALAISGIRFVPFVLGSAAGFLPWVVVWVLGTREVASRAEGLSTFEAVTLGVAVVVFIIAMAWWRRRAAAKRQATTRPSEAEAP